MTVGLRMLDVGQVQAVTPEAPKAAVADSAAVFHTLRDGDGAMIPGPGRMISREDVLLVFFFLSQFLSGNPPPRDFLDVCGIRHVDDHERIAVRALVVFQSQLIVPAAIEGGVLSTVVEILLRARA